LKKKQLLGYDFHRQKPLDKYIVDFYCQKLKLIIEIDGVSHNDKSEYDQKRQKELENHGFKILRFTEHEVQKKIGDVLTIILSFIHEYTSR